MPLHPENPLVKFALRPFNQIVSEVIPLMTALYFTIKKLLDTSIEGVMDEWFKPAFTSIFLGTVIAIIIYACLLKILILAINKISVLPTFRIRSSEFFHIIRRINAEIEDHVKLLQSSRLHSNIFGSLLKYRINVASIVSDFHTEIVQTFTGKGIAKRNIVVSFYHCEGDPLPCDKLREISYCVHCDISCGQISTKTISMDDTSTRDFIAARVLERGGVQYLTDASRQGYLVADVERRQTIKQYIGIPIESRDLTVGILNIEIHSKPIFNDLDEMKSFYSEIAYGYKNQLEYQVNKRSFFSLVNDQIGEMFTKIKSLETRLDIHEATNSAK